MGRNDSLFPWKCFRVLQFAIFAVSINAAVKCTQFFTPVSPYFVREVLGWKLEDSGLLSGALVGVYYLGRAITHRCWIRGSLDFGFRPVLLLAIIIETVMTFGISLANNIIVALVLRLIAGCFSPIASVTALLVRRLSEDFGEDFPLVAGTLTFVSTLGLIIGYLISGCVAFPAENKIVEGSVFRQFPFMFAWMLDASIMFLCLFCLCLEFPDLLAEKETPRKVNRPPRVDKVNPGKYEELTEQGTAQTDGQRIDSTSGPIITTNQENPPTNQENPITERKEGGDPEEEELPGYLQCFDLEEVHSAEIAAGGAPLSHRSAMMPSPIASPREKEGGKPMTERVPRKAQNEERKVSRVENSEIPALISKLPDQSVSMHPPNRSEKTTFISFVEEDFHKALNSTKVASLDDPHKRPPGEHPVPYRWSCIVSCLCNFLGAWLETTFVLWMIVRTKDEVSVELVGVVLAWSMAGSWLNMFMFSALCVRVPLHQAFVGHCLLLIFVLGATAAAPRAGVGGVVWVLAVLGLAFVVKYCTSFLCTFGMLLLGDSGFLYFRTFIVLKGETWVTFAKACGYTLGPLLFSIGESLNLSHYEPSLLAAGILTLLTAVLNVLGSKHFPRFKDCPYAM